MDFSKQWRFEAIRLAAMEQLEMDGVITPESLFPRAKMIYSRGHQAKISEWSSVWDEGEPKEEKPAKKVEVKINEDGKKECPSCGELVPAGWAKHSFKEDGSNCGYQF